MGVGFAKDGESSLRNNSKLKNRTRDKYFKAEHKYKKAKPLKTSVFSEESKHKLHIKLSLQKKSERNRALIVVVVMMLAISLCIFSLINS